MVVQVFRDHLLIGVAGMAEERTGHGRAGWLGDDRIRHEQQDRDRDRQSDVRETGQPWSQIGHGHREPDRERGHDLDQVVVPPVAAHRDSEQAADHPDLQQAPHGIAGFDQELAWDDAERRLRPQLMVDRPAWPTWLMPGIQKS